MIVKKLKIKGRVQGVCYRASMQDAARNIGICGYAKNLSDGSVEAVIIGDKEQIDKIIAWCYKGPILATTEAIDIEDLLAFETIKDFEIRY